MAASIMPPLVSDEDKALEIYDLLKDIKDPEHPYSLEHLNVLSEDSVKVTTATDGLLSIVINFTPTVPHCSLATLIGLCIRIKLERCLEERHKMCISIQKGTHSTEDEINKQINDKERVSAAMENPNLRSIVEECLQDSY